MVQFQWQCEHDQLNDGDDDDNDGDDHRVADDVVVTNSNRYISVNRVFMCACACAGYVNHVNMSTKIN